MPKETIIVFCAHNDDQIIGAGGTLAKYAREGKDVLVYVFSFGESSHPHYHKDEIITRRVHELHHADDVIKIKKSFFLGLKEGDFFNDFSKKKRKDVIVRAIKENNPSKIFTHSTDDPHKDHQAVNNIVISIAKELQYTGSIFTFDVWNPFNLRNRNLPKLVVDIKETLPLKVKAFTCHRSQVPTLLIMMPSIYIRALLTGLQYGKGFCEKFTKIQ